MYTGDSEYDYLIDLQGKNLSIEGIDRKESIECIVLARQDREDLCHDDAPTHDRKIFSHRWAFYVATD